MKQKTISYVLGFLCFLAPIHVWFCLRLGWGSFLAIGPYIVSSQDFVTSTIKFLSSALGLGFCLLLALALLLAWFISGIVSIVLTIASIFVKKWSLRTRILFTCTFIGYLLSFTWIKFNPSEQQISYALHSHISIGTTPSQVVKVLSSLDINYSDAIDPTLIEAYIPDSWENEYPYIVDFHFTDNKLTYFTVASQQELYEQIK